MIANRKIFPFFLNKNKNLLLIVILLFRSFKKINLFEKEI